MKRVLLTGMSGTGKSTLIGAPATVLVERLATRTNNPYGKRSDELERVRLHLQTVEPLLRRAATLEVDTSAPVEQVLKAILDLVTC